MLINTSSTNSIPHFAYSYDCAPSIPMYDTVLGTVQFTVQYQYQVAANSRYKTWYPRGNRIITLLVVYLQVAEIEIKLFI